MEAAQRCGLVNYQSLTTLDVVLRMIKSITVLFGLLSLSELISLFRLHGL